MFSQRWTTIRMATEDAPQMQRAASLEPEQIFNDATPALVTGLFRERRAILIRNVNL
jgi:hypothetical protein